MSPSLASMCALGLLVLLLPFALGAGVYEHRIAVPHWLRVEPDGSRHWDAAAATHDDVGRRFWAVVTTLPLTLLVLANAWFAWSATGDARPWWLAAVLLTLADRGLTFGYFIPAMIALMRAADTPDAVEAAARWVAFGYLRHALLLAAAVAALRAFALLQRS
jgi:hypothetical protein